MSASPARSEILVHPARYQRGWSKHRFPGPGYHLSVGSVGSAWQLGGLAAHGKMANVDHCRPHSSKFIPFIKCHYSGNHLTICATCNFNHIQYTTSVYIVYQCAVPCSKSGDIWGHLGPRPTVKPAEELTPSISTFARTHFTRKSSELLKNWFTATVLRQALLTESNESLNFGCRVRPWIRMA